MKNKTQLKKIIDLKFEKKQINFNFKNSVLYLNRFHAIYLTQL